MDRRSSENSGACYRAPPRIYSVADTDVVPPIVVRQDMPWFQRTRRGVIDVLVNESGRVETAELRQSVNVSFDRQLLDAAKRWQYQPRSETARRDDGRDDSRTRIVC